MKHKIYLVTSHFPYTGGEQFLETEITYYSQYKNIDLTLLPLRTSNTIRRIDENILVSDFINKNFSKKRLRHFLKALACGVSYKELVSLKYSQLFQPKLLKSMLSSLIAYIRYLEVFDKYFATQEGLENSILYTYWHTEATYALETLKKKYGYKLVSRIHGYDLYQKRRTLNYMPLKHQFTNIDQLHVITKSATDYLCTTYGFKSSNIMLNRLGVKDHGITSKQTGKNHLHVVSCSYLSAVKRVDKIILALANAARVNNHITYTWTHIGDGALSKELKQLATEQLKQKNVNFQFLGHLSNANVYDFYRKHDVDVFINTSESEGVPVSIMEAMSCHIPIIAPDVGGIHDMVNDNQNGRLLSCDATIAEVSDALSNQTLYKNSLVRQAAHAKFITHYDASKNYAVFIDSLIT